MSVRIVNVEITTDYSWQDLKNQTDWATVKNTNTNWQQPVQTATVGQTIKIEVEIVENNWEGVNQSFINWQEIKDKFTNWLGFKNQ